MRADERLGRGPVRKAERPAARPPAERGESPPAAKRRRGPGQNRQVDARGSGRRRRSPSGSGTTSAAVAHRRPGMRPARRGSARRESRPATAAGCGSSGTTAPQPLKVSPRRHSRRGAPRTLSGRARPRSGSKIRLRASPPRPAGRSRPGEPRGPLRPPHRASDRAFLTNERGAIRAMRCDELASPRRIAVPETRIPPILSRSESL